MKYMIGCSYMQKPGLDWQYDRSKLWAANVKKWAKPEPDRIIVVCQGGKMSAPVDGVQRIDLSGDLGSHVHLLSGQKTNEFGGWFGGVFALAMLAYNNESDLIYQEQDCLSFGPFVDHLYSGIGGAGIYFGRKMRSAPFMSCSQSLFLLRFWFIREFIVKMFGSAPMRTHADLGEAKFMQFANADPQKWAQFDFGYDRERPFNMDADVFYIQQFTEEDVQALKARGFID